MVLILFGAKKLPELAKGLGTGIKEFKKATREVTDEIHTAMDDTAAPAQVVARQQHAAHHAARGAADRSSIHSRHQGLIR